MDGRAPHLKPWRDGWRHFRFMLLYSPAWLFMLPGGSLLAVGMGLFLMLLLGCQILAQGFYAKVFAIAEGLLPSQPRFSRLFKAWNLERGIVLGLVLCGAGASVIGGVVWHWAQRSFGIIDPQENLGRLIVGTTLLVLGTQTVFSSFHLSLLGLKTTGRTPPDPTSVQAGSASSDSIGAMAKPGAVLPKGEVPA